MYYTIIFDMDDTLSDERINTMNAFKKVLEYKNEQFTEEKYEIFNKIDIKFWSDRAKGLVNDPDNFASKDEKTNWVRSQRFILYFKDITIDEALKLNDIYVDALREKIVGIDGAKDTVKYLYDKGYEIVIATNGPSKALYEKLERIEIKPYIKYIVAADKVGYMKPKKPFFDSLFKTISEKDTHKMFIIGDELEKDVRGGVENNIDSCWFNRKCEKFQGDYKPTYEIKNLKELKFIL